MERMLLAITVYNCEGRIIKVLNQLNNSILKYFEEVLILNSDSTDNTKEEVKEYISKHPGKPLKLISNEKHSGLGTAVKFAFSYALANNYAYLMLVRGDNQIRISDFLPVLQTGIYRKHDCVLGARFMKGSQLRNYSVWRICGNIGMNMIYSLICHKKIYDLGAGIDLYSVAMLKPRYYEKFPENSLFHSLMLLSEKSQKHDFLFFPIRAWENGTVYPIKIVNQSLFLLEWALHFLLCKDSIEGDYRRKW